MPASPERTHRRESAAIDELLRAVANEGRRLVLYYLRESHDVATVDELITDLSATMETDHGRIAVKLHHQILPHLIDADLIAVDRESDQVQYVGGSFESALIDWLRDQNL
jgi:hypothetical protein